MKLRFGLAVLAFCATGFAQENYAHWTKYKNIVINTKASGANVATTVAKFPVLVRLNAANAADVFTGAQAGGADIRFANAAGVARPYQIESWDATAQSAAIWVLADSVKGNDSSFALRLYWGKASAPSLSNGPAVFDTAADWRAVYHMNGGTAATEMDATAHAVNLSASDSVAGAIPGDTVGMVGKARKFAGDTLTPAGRQYFVAPGTAQNPAVNLRPNAAYSISAWMYARTISAKNGHGNSVINKGDRQYAMQIYGGTGSTAKQFEAATYTSTWRQAKSKGLPKAAAGQWYHITGTWSGGANNTTGTGKLYVNGVLDSTTSMAIGNSNPDTVYNLFVGANPSAGSNSPAAGTTKSLSSGISANPRFWDGYLDELSISRGVRSDDFVKLTYETQKATAAAVALGATQTQTVVPDSVKNVYYTMQGAGNTPRDTNVFTATVPVNLLLKYTGGPIDSVKITQGTLPAGLTVNLLTGTLSGTPTTATAAANQTLTVYTSLGNVTRGLRLSVLPGPTSGFGYAQDTATYVTGQAYSNSPVYSGRAPTSFTITPALPAGLALNATSGIISGTPTAVSAATNYTVKGMNATDTVTKVIRITVVTVGTEDYSTWTGSKQIWLNTQGNGAAVQGNVTKFPVLVRMDSASGFNAMFAAALAGGADLRFTKGTGTTTRLPHQIESWDATAKKAAVWVLLDTVIGSNGTQTFFARWGKAGAVDLSYGPAVFDTANGFEAVWHMNGTANELDATPNGFTASSALLPTSGAGAIGTARVFNGTSQYLTVPGSAASRMSFSVVQDYTLSGWVNPAAISTATGTGHKIVEKGDNQWTLATYGSGSDPKYWEITTKLNNGAATWAQAHSGTTQGTLLVANPIIADSGIGKWNLITGVYRGAPAGGSMAETLYVNGVAVNARSEAISDTGASRTVTVQVHIGVQSGAAPSGTFTRYWNGTLDEIRVQSKARSADWIKLEYANQRPAGQTLVSFTPPVSIASKSGNALVAGGLGMNVKNLGNGLMFTIEGANAGDKATLSLVDMYGRTVYSGAFNSGSQLSWNGESNNGHSVSAGIYVARVTVIDAQSKLRKVLESRVPFTK